MTKEILTYSDLNEITPSVNKRHIAKINETIQRRLLELGIIKKCDTHIPRFTKLATISNPEWEARQWGYKCTECGVRLHPTGHFVEYKDEHYNMYLDLPRLVKPKTALEIAAELVT